MTKDSKVYIGLELTSDEIAILAPFLSPATKEEVEAAFPDKQ